MKLSERLFIIWMVLSIPLGFLIVCCSLNYLPDKLNNYIELTYKILRSLGFTYVISLICILTTKTIYTNLNINLNATKRKRVKVFNK